MNSYTNEKGVFKNLLGITNNDVLRKEEYEYTTFRANEILNNIIDLGISSYGIDRQISIHSHIFQDVYGWAGKTRIVKSSKISNGIVSEFENPCNIIQSWNVLENEINSFLNSSSSFENNVLELINIFVFANRIHPFPDGNGRSLQVFMKQLAKEKNIDVDYTKVKADEWNYASAVSGTHGRIIDFVRGKLPPPNIQPITKIFIAISSQI